MFWIEENTIHITRGDKGTIELSIDDYTFSLGDKIELRVYRKRELEKLPVLTKVIEVLEECTSVDIELTPQDTSLGEYINKPEDYWYEVELNDNQTVIGFDENGSKILRLYPEGKEENI